jgi:hypothetical protein
MRTCEFILTTGLADCSEATAGKENWPGCASIAIVALKLKGTYIHELPFFYCAKHATQIPKEQIVWQIKLNEIK